MPVISRNTAVWSRVPRRVALRSRSWWLLVLAGVLNGDRGEVGEENDGLQLLLIKRRPVQAIDGEYAEDPTADGERHHDRGLRQGLRARNQLRSRVGSHVVHELRRLVAHDPAAHASLEGAAPRANLVSLVTGGEGAEQLAGPLIDKADVHGIVLHHLLEQGRNLREEVVLVEGGEKRGAEVEHGVAQGELRLKRRGRALELLVLTGVLDSHGGVGREHLERFHQIERGQSAIGRIVQIENAHELVLLVEQRYQQIVVGVPLVVAP
jgi:hypothetical protein